MARLHLVYRKENLDGHILELTERFLAMRPWHKSSLPLYETWAHGAAIAYGLPDVQVIWNTELTPNRVGRYVAATEGQRALIILHRLSVISLFHQFRHHIQAHAKPGAYPSQAHADEDAQAWACSLLYVLQPRRFRRMVRAGRIAGVKARDLLKSRRGSA